MLSENNSNKEILIKNIISQTNYDEYTAYIKLQEFDYDYMKVIKDYMGIKDNNSVKVKSINQEIYKQFRTNLDQVTKSYRDKNPINIEHAANNFNESEIKNRI
jgi:hypothetical protein